VSVGERRGQSRGAGLPLRVLPSPDSPEGRAELLAAAWASDAEQDDWCVDAGAALRAGCALWPGLAPGDSGVAAMPASERRAVHLTRQRIRAQAVLAAALPLPAAERRARVHRLAIFVGSGLLHLLGFVVLATAVADLQPSERPSTHEHLFEARAIIPIETIELEPASETRAELAEDRAEPPVVAAPSQAKPDRASAPQQAPAEPQAAPAEPAAYELSGFELSSEGELAAGDPGGRAWGQPGGSGAGPSKGAGSGSGSGGHGSHGPATPDVSANPRGGLLEPEYPAELERRGIEGSVLVKVWIDEHGHVIKAEVGKSSGHEAFDHNALMTAQRQAWSPALHAGEAVSSTRRYRVHFRQR